MRPVFAFDLSCNKPAMTALVDGKISFYIWPSKIDSVAYNKLSDCGVNITDRGLESIKDKTFNQHTLILEHVNRAKNMAYMIESTIAGILENTPHKKEDAIIANESFAFSAKGDAVLELSGYKYILMDRLIESGYKTFRTYSPITIKKNAGCSKRGLGKDAMIMALANEPDSTHTLIDVIKSDPQLLKKKTNFVMCMDDIADSYWCLKTCLNDLNDNV